MRRWKRTSPPGERTLPPKREVVWTPEAEQDRLHILNYIAERDPDAAARMDLVFAAAVANLATFPLLGHAGDAAGTRELTPHRSYRLVYEVAGDLVWILALVHSARRWPPLAD